MGDKFWMVTDPEGPNDVLEDICFQADCASLELAMLCGLQVTNAAILTGEHEAKAEALNRLTQPSGHRYSIS